MLNVRSGSWPRDNATEWVSGDLDRSVVAQDGHFEHIFPISIWEQRWCVPRSMTALISPVSIFSAAVSFPWLCGLFAFCIGFHALAYVIHRFVPKPSTRWVALATLPLLLTNCLGIVSV